MAKYVKPTLDTKFHVDFAWWQQKGQNLRAFLKGHVCAKLQGSLHLDDIETFDWVNPETAEVFKIDKLWYEINAGCQDDPNFIDSRAPLTTAIFRAFLANNNTPLTPDEIYDKIQKQSPEMILRTIGRRQVYKGIKPVTS